MQIRVLLHGVLIRLAGRDAIELECAPQSSVQTVLDTLADALPSLAQELDRTACAIGDSLVSRDTVLEPEAELVLIPPVSGG